MLILSLLAAIHMQSPSRSADTARLVADTVFIEPVGISLTVPSLWMGRIPAGASMSSPGRGRFACQLMSRVTLEERVLVERSALSALQQGPRGLGRLYQEALDSILPSSSIAAHVGGGDGFKGSCLAPQFRFYVIDSATAHPAGFGAKTLRVLEREHSGIERSESDSAGWHIVRLSWTDRKTDFIHPGTLEIWSRPIGARLFVAAMMDGWSGRGDANDLLASIQWRRAAGAIRLARCEGPAWSLPDSLARKLPPRTGSKGPDDHWADLAMVVPGGFGGIFYDSTHTPILMLTDPSQESAAKQALDGKIGFPVQQFTVRQARWNFAQLVDWFNYLAPRTGGVPLTGDKDEVLNRVRFSVTSIEQRDRVVNALGRLSLPCDLVVVDLNGLTVRF